MKLLPRGLEIEFEDGYKRYLRFNVQNVYILQENFNKPIDDILNNDLLKGKDKCLGNLIKVTKIMLDEDMRRQKKVDNKDIPEITIEHLEYAIDNAYAKELMLALVRLYNGSLPDSDGKTEKNV